jgi:hypothetical protein
MDTVRGGEVLQMESRGLDYARVEESLVEQSCEYCKSADHR